MVRAMRVANTREVAKARERCDRETSMNEPVVHHRIGQAEERHADPEAEGHVAQKPLVRSTSVQNERNRDGRVKCGQHVVRFEARGTHRVMRAMYAPQEAVPHAPMEERGPWLHHRACDERRRDPNERARDHDSLLATKGLT
jgi:hypothetical protein